MQQEENEALCLYPSRTHENGMPPFKKTLIHATEEIIYCKGYLTTRPPYCVLHKLSKKESEYWYISMFQDKPFKL